MRRTPSPARNPPSRILHVDHLTRPFTKLQLLELLTEDGEIIKEAFWTNKFRSQCIALVRDLFRGWGVNAVYVFVICEVEIDSVGSGGVATSYSCANIKFLFYSTRELNRPLLPELVFTV